MMYTGDVILKGGLSVKADKPLDDRTVVSTKSELNSLHNKYEGMQVTVLDEKKIYILSGNQWITHEDGPKIVTLTQAEYESLGNNLDEDTYYFIKEEDNKQSIFDQLEDLLNRVQTLETKVNQLENP